MASAKRPLIAAGPRDTFGGFRETHTAPDMTRDPTFVPGYSDKRVAVAEAARTGAPGPKLAYRLHWVRTKSVSGRPDMRGPYAWQAKGYQPVTKDHLTALGIQMPPAGAFDASGHIVTGDTELWFAPAAVAARNEGEWRRATESLSADDTVRAGLNREASQTFGSGTDDIAFVETESRQAE